MPDKTGIEISQTIHEDPHLSDIPRMLLTSMMSPPKEKVLKEVGISLCMQKPVSTQSLCNSLCALSGITSAKAALEAGQRTDTPLKLDRLRVLVAEDNDTNTLVIKGMLKKLGIIPICVSDGGQAIDEVKTCQQGFDVILMDCEMPNIDGYQATGCIRDYELQQGNEPATIIAITSPCLI